MEHKSQNGFGNGYGEELILNLPKDLHKITGCRLADLDGHGEQTSR